MAGVPCGEKAGNLQRVYRRASRSADKGYQDASSPTTTLDFASPAIRSPSPYSLPCSFRLDARHSAAFSVAAEVARSVLQSRLLHMQTQECKLTLFRLEWDEDEGIRIIDIRTDVCKLRPR